MNIQIRYCWYYFRVWMVGGSYPYRDDSDWFVLVCVSHPETNERTLIRRIVGPYRSSSPLSISPSPISPFSFPTSSLSTTSTTTTTTTHHHTRCQTPQKTHHRRMSTHNQIITTPLSPRNKPFLKPFPTPHHRHNQSSPSPTITLTPIPKPSRKTIRSL